MAFYVEEEVWKCLKHPSKHRRTGICPTCLRDRLLSLCPNCSHRRPCPCSSSSSATTTTTKPSSLIDTEPNFRRSRSLAVPFLRSSSRFNGEHSLSSSSSPRMSFWRGFFKREKGEESTAEVERKRMIYRSRSVAVAVTSELGSGDVMCSSSLTRKKGRKWHFPSPMSVFNQQSRLYRG